MTAHPDRNEDTDRQPLGEEPLGDDEMLSFYCRLLELLVGRQGRELTAAEGMALLKRYGRGRTPYVEEKLARGDTLEAKLLLFDHAHHDRLQDKALAVGYGIERTEHALSMARESLLGPRSDHLVHGRVYRAAPAESLRTAALEALAEIDELRAALDRKARDRHPNRRDDEGAGAEVPQPSAPGSSSASTPRTRSRLDEVAPTHEIVKETSATKTEIAPLLAPYEQRWVGWNSFAKYLSSRGVEGVPANAHKVPVLEAKEAWVKQRKHTLYRLGDALRVAWSLSTSREAFVQIVWDDAIENMTKPSDFDPNSAEPHGGWRHRPASSQ